MVSQVGKNKYVNHLKTDETKNLCRLIGAEGV